MSEEKTDEQGPEHQTATSQATLDLPGITGLNNPDLVTAAFPADPPKANEVYQAVYMPPSLAQAHEIQANPAPTTDPMPVAKPQRISLPLHPRRGGEIHLSEEAAQLAMSPARVGGIDKPRLSAAHSKVWEALMASIAEDKKKWVAMKQKEGLK